MTLAVEIPADHWEALAYLRAATWLVPGSAAKCAHQVFASRTVGWRDAQGLVCALGLYPDGPGAEAWLVGDGARARPHLSQIARQARLTLAAAAHHGVAPIRASVRAGWTPGRRLAALTGFVAVSSFPATEPVDWFEWRGTTHGRHGQQDVRRRRGRSEGGRARGAAPA